MVVIACELVLDMLQLYDSSLRRDVNRRDESDLHWVGILHFGRQHHCANLIRAYAATYAVSHWIGVAANYVGAALFENAYG